jgi:nicotinamide-nucleotide amidase
VSAACAEAMADGIRRVLATDWGVSTTGVAGPTAQEGKPVGLVYVGLSGPTGTAARELHLDGERAEVRAAAVAAAVETVLAAVTEVSDQD